MDKQFSLRRPCANCPFRKDHQAIELAEGRREQIIEGLLNGEAMSFHCHKTVRRGNGVNFDADGNYAPKDVCHCPGAIAVARKFGRDAVSVQLAERLGLIPLDHYDLALEDTVGAEELLIDRVKARI